MKTAIGIDIGGTNSVFGIVDSAGKCLCSDTLRTDAYNDPELFIVEFARRIDVLKTLLQFTPELIGIGIGAPKGNYFKGTVEFAPNLNWKGIVPIAEMVKRHFNLPVLLTNDANAAAVGEMLYGAARGMNDFVVVTLGTGVGSGFVVNGKLLYGHDGFAGELGHTIVDPDGRECGCGRKGCLETYASAKGITRTVVEMLQNTDKKSILRKYTPADIDSRIIYEAALQNDRLAVEAFDFTGKILGIKLADMVAITSPEAIILFGGLANAGELIFKPVKFYMEKYLLKIFRNKVKLIPSLLNDDNAAVLGAAALIWNETQGKIITA